MNMRWIAILIIFVSSCTGKQSGNGERTAIVKTLQSPGQTPQSTSLVKNNSPRILHVGKDQPVKSIRQAIEKANAGDTIAVHSGVYREGNIQITKPLTLLGIEMPVLDGEQKHEILTVSGRSITIHGFQFLNSGRSSMNDYASVKVVDADRIVIADNRITNANFGIHLSNSTNCEIRSNEIKGTPTTEQNTGNGIHLWKSSYALIENNFISGHRDGIYFEFVTHSTISKNISDGNIRYGIHFMFSNDDRYLENTFRNNGAGVAVMYSKNVQMESNHFERNWGAAAYGILLKEISDSRILKNTFVENTVGIFMEGTSRVQVNDNLFKENGCAMKVQASCNENNFSRNNFFGNSFDVATNGTMMLNTFSNNYWDKYEGYDMNRDGIGDIPYHPVSVYAMIVEQNPNALILLRSFMVTLLDKAEKAIPSLTPEQLADHQPMLKPLKS